MANTISEHILLTGAGFTANFNGFLAEGMWSEIFNHPEIKDRDNIKKIMVMDFDYETLYHKIIKGQNQELFSDDILKKTVQDAWLRRVSDDDKRAIKKAVYEAYLRLDDQIRNYNIHNFDNLSFAIKKLFRFFAGERDTVGIIFTLNQDLFVERYYDGDKSLCLPGSDIPVIPRPADRQKKDKLNPEDFITLKGNIANISVDDLSHRELNYIKLHGSLNWESFDGSHMMVIGLDKHSQISKEPLLDLYFDLFKQALSLPKRKLFVIGYGFRDSHVNEVISDSILKHKLKLIVISPQRPRDFISNLKDNSNEYPYGPIIITGLISYYPYDLARLIDGDSFRFIKDV